MYRVTLRPGHGGVQTEAAVLERETCHVTLTSHQATHLTSEAVGMEIPAERPQPGGRRLSCAW